MRGLRPRAGRRLACFVRRRYARAASHRRLPLRSCALRVVRSREALSFGVQLLYLRQIGYLHSVVASIKFSMLQGAESSVTYTFNTGIAKHLFCCVCGVKSFYVPRSHPDSYSVNARSSMRRLSKPFRLNHSMGSIPMCATPNPSLNADVPHAGLRPRSGPPVSLFR